MLENRFFIKAIDETINRRKLKLFGFVLNKTLYTKKKKGEKVMKKFLALFVICIMLMTLLASCDLSWLNPEKPCTEHVDANGDYICDNCEAELEKPHEHADADGDNVCDGCGEKLGEPDAEKVLVEDIIVSTDDDEGEGTIENPFKVNLAQGNSIDLSYAVQPKDATDKSFTWSVVDEGKGITFSDNGTKLTITAAADATSALVEGKANDGSGVKVYLSVIIEVYNAVTGITSSTLLFAFEFESVFGLGICNEGI